MSIIEELRELRKQTNDPKITAIANRMDEIERNLNYFTSEDFGKLIDDSEFNRGEWAAFIQVLEMLRGEE